MVDHGAAKSVAVPRRLIASLRQRRIMPPPGKMRTRLN